MCLQAHLYKHVLDRMISWVFAALSPVPGFGYTIFTHLSFGSKSILCNGSSGCVTVQTMRRMQRRRKKNEETKRRLRWSFHCTNLSQTALLQVYKSAHILPINNLPLLFFTSPFKSLWHLQNYPSTNMPVTLLTPLRNLVPEVCSMELKLQSVRSCRSSPSPNLDSALLSWIPILFWSPKNINAGPLDLQVKHDQ